jgi:iron(III)-enterobactin esterase
MNAKLCLSAITLCLLFDANSIFADDLPAAQKGAEPKASDPAPAVKAAAPATETPAAPAQAQKKGNRPPPPPASEADLADIAKLNDLPPYKTGLPDGDYLLDAPYSPTPEQTVRDDVPKGKIVNFTVDSAESKIFPGRDGAFQRKVAVYIPAQYKAGTPAPFVVSCDQYGLNYKLSTILDNMIADKRLPPLVAIMIANGGNPNRSYEYDTVSGKYAEWVESEVLPRVEKETGVTLTKDPDARMTLGGSSGGICAFTMAWFHPELYHRVLSYSGTFVNLQRGPDAPHGGWGYHENFIGNTPAKPIRAWLHVSENDNGAKSASSAMRNWVIANQRMAKALKDKNYHYQFVYTKNSGHTDGKVINQTLPQALEYVWRGYPIDAGK